MAETKKTTKKVEGETTETKKVAKKTATKTSAPKKTTAKKTAAKTEETVTETKKATKKTTAKKETTKKTTAKKETAKKAKKVEVVETKPVVTEAHAKAISVKCTPRKARLVIDLVRGKDCDEALEILFNVNHRACTPVSKLIKSAVANATNNFNMNPDKLYIASIQASDSIKMRRYLPRAKGSASGLVKRFCNIYITVKERN